MQRPLSDWGGNLGAFALTILLNVLSNALPINDQTMPEISARYPSLFTPAGFTFGIWGLIYLALLVFVVWQALPAQRTSAKLARISVPFKINCLANASWIVVWHYDLLALSMLVMLAGGSMAGQMARLGSPVSRAMRVFTCPSTRFF